ncbi:hypothetical protein J456_4154, partial [Acinetobacter baumannii 959073]
MVYLCYYLVEKYRSSESLKNMIYYSMMMNTSFC